MRPDASIKQAIHSHKSAACPSNLEAIGNLSEESRQMGWMRVLFCAGSQAAVDAQDPHLPGRMCIPRSQRLRHALHHGLNICPGPTLHLSRSILQDVPACFLLPAVPIRISERPQTLTSGIACVDSCSILNIALYKSPPTPN